MPKRIQYIQLAGDALIPLLGFYVWDWSIYFILLFYFADLITSELFIWVRSEKIRRSGKTSMKQKAVMRAILSLFFLTSSILFVNLGIRFLHQELQYLHELHAFWTYEEMGIQQGHILIPLLLIVGYQQYRLEFVLSGAYTRMTIDELWRSHTTNRVLLLASCAIGCGIVYFLSVPDQAVLWLIVAGSAVFTLFFDRTP